ncbi:putative SAM-dependent methyltransferase [Magnetospira sp. QH-2]|nr:putative SAM-dependent methyltransferase [Magnetospira sp. QH-2]
MWNDIVDLRDFYAGDLGHVARRALRRRLRLMWPDVTGMNILGLGYASPYLGLFRSEAQRIVAAMPAPQGVLHWPSDESNLTALTEELDLPFPDLSMDLVLLAHGLESSENVRPLLREVWRVLSGSGRLLIMVPNRRGLWAQTERTPFGHGHPYSPSQISRLLRECLFTPTRTDQALFIPPFRWRMMLSAAPAWEKLGGRWFPGLGGVLLVEAGKQLYAGTTVPAKAPRRSYRLLARPNSGGLGRQHRK